MSSDAVASWAQHCVLAGRNSSSQQNTDPVLAVLEDWFTPLPRYKTVVRESVPAPCTPLTRPITCSERQSKRASKTVGERGTNRPGCHRHLTGLTPPDLCLLFKAGTASQLCLCRPLWVIAEKTLPLLFQTCRHSMLLLHCVCLL